MTIFVDELKQAITPAHNKWRYRYYCHLTTDSDDIEDLHKFAELLGLRREWFQPHVLHPHYDLTASKREKAIEFGAVFVDSFTQAKWRLSRGVQK